MNCAVVDCKNQAGKRYIEVRLSLSPRRAEPVRIPVCDEHPWAETPLQRDTQVSVVS